MNKLIRIRAKEALKSRKRCVSSVVFPFLALAAGIIAVRMVVINGKTPYAIAAGVVLSVAYFVIKSCANYRLQAQMILLLTNGGKPKIKFAEYAKNMWLAVLLFLLKTVELLAFEAIPVCVVAALFLSIKSSAQSIAFCIIMLIGAAVTAFSGLIFFAFSVQKYAKAPFLLAAYPSLTVKDCIKLSIEKGEKKAAELLRFKLGFLPWTLACAAIFPLLYVVPYYKQSLTCWFKQES
ncbi:MAG: hypothetical protein IKM25_00195 [Clostridia bacterium]|nr:hypothetical protein [Clostridia bacterium]